MGVSGLALKIFLKFVTETIFNIASSLLYKWHWRSLLSSSGCHGVYFRKDSNVYYKLQWWSFICSNLWFVRSRRFLKKPLIISQRQHHGAHRRNILSSLKAQKVNSAGTFALPSYSYKNEFCIVFTKTFLNINVL